MLSSIVAVFVGIWFYNTGLRSGRLPVSWAVSGIVIYFLAALFWTLAVTPSIKDLASHSQSGLLIFMVRYAYIGFGVLIAIVLNRWLNKSSDSQ